MPHRDSFLELIRAYLVDHPEEIETVDRYRRFVEGQAKCFERSLQTGHVTGSAWVVDPAGERVLLTHHRKLGIWLQLGGHADGEPDVCSVARREAEEESGLEVDLLDAAIFDLDIHVIPARRAASGGVEPEHEHFDVRFVFQARSVHFSVSEESHDLAWVPIGGLADYAVDESVQRMAAKWRGRRDRPVPHG